MFLEGTSDKPNFNSFLEVSIFKQVTLKLVTLPFTTNILTSLVICDHFLSHPCTAPYLNWTTGLSVFTFTGDQGFPETNSNEYQSLWPNFQWFIVFLFEKNMLVWLKLNQPIWTNIMMPQVKLDHFHSQGWKCHKPLKPPPRYSWTWCFHQPKETFQETQGLIWWPWPCSPGDVLHDGWGRDSHERCQNHPFKLYHT